MVVRVCAVTTLEYGKKIHTFLASPRVATAVAAVVSALVGAVYAVQHCAMASILHMGYLPVQHGSAVGDPKKGTVPQRQAKIGYTLLAGRTVLNSNTARRT